VVLVHEVVSLIAFPVVAAVAVGVVLVRQICLGRLLGLGRQLLGLRGLSGVH
jgi:hypothetical protein